MEHRKQALLRIFLPELLLYRIFLNQSSRLKEQGFPMVGGLILLLLFALKLERS